MTSPKQVADILFFDNKNCATDCIFPNLLLRNRELNLKVIYNNLINPYFLHMHVLFSLDLIFYFCFFWTCVYYFCTNITLFMFLLQMALVPPKNI